MQVLVVSSPGHGSEPHWSHALAAQVVAAVRERGGDATWMAALPKGQQLADAAGGEPIRFERANRALSSVAANHCDNELDLRVTRFLREHPAAVVVHLGMGARGTPNVLWLADRLGSRVFAAVDGVELVCERGELVDRDGAACSNFEDAERCRWCCTASFWSKPHVVDLQNRTDLLIAGLLVVEKIFVGSDEDTAFTKALGVSAKRVHVGRSAAAIVDAIA